jgi:hypothetical protein
LDDTPSPRRGGRAPGVQNRATRAVRDVLNAFAAGRQDKHLKRLHDLTTSKDDHVALKALTLTLAYRFGRPAETLALTGADGGPVEVRFVEVNAP